LELALHIGKVEVNNFELDRLRSEKREKMGAREETLAKRESLLVQNSD
jgi:hypothetical protein